MRVALLARGLRAGGGYVVGINFLRCLPRVAPAHRFLAVVPPDAGYEEIVLPPGSRMVVYRGSHPLRHWRFDTRELPRLLREFGPDAVLGLGNFGVTVPGYRQALLVHMSHLVYPSRHYGHETPAGRLKIRLSQRRLRQCLRYTDLVFCQTPVVRERLQRTYGFPPERIEILPNAVSELAKLDRDEAAVPSVFSGRRGFDLFFLTRFYAQKNLESLIELFRHHRRELEGVRCIVTVSPRDHTNAGRFLAAVRRHGLEESIVNVGPLRQDELAGYFFHADALLFPTLLESFSGTYLEAMHFGLPILTSDLDFARYVCGDAALYFDPWNPADIAEKIGTLRADPALATRLAEAGRQRVARFFRSWEEIVGDALARIERLVATGT